MINSSTIYINSIDQNYPSITKDNDSQQFRNNFKNIKEGLKKINLDNEILVNNIVDPSKNINNFNYNIIKRSKFEKLNTVIYDESNIIQQDDFLINYKNGYYQKFLLNSGTHKINLINFPTNNKAGTIILELTTSSNFETSIYFNEEMYSFEKVIFPLSLEGTNPHIFKIINENNNYYFLTLKESNNVNAPINIKNYNNITTIDESTSGSIVFLSSNINSIAFNTGTNWIYVTGTKLSVAESSTVILISEINLIKDQLTSGETPIVGSSGYQPITYTILPELPTGLVFNSTTGEITGTSTIILASTTYTVTVTDAIGNTSSKNFTLSVTE